MNVPRLLFRLVLGRRLPTTTGTLKVPGIRETIVIRRDSYGIPHIEAQGEEDAWYAVGFCQGQDRAFQLEGFLRVVRGTLSELVGEKGLVVDRLSRRIGFLKSAQRQLGVLDSDLRNRLHAFARGITDGGTLGCSRPAHEFTLLRGRPTPYTAADTLGIAKLESFALASNWDAELARLRILREDGREALEALDPSYPEWQPVSVPPGAPAGPSVDRLAEDMVELGAAISHGGGSNNWAIAPARTASGRPILANDVHLAPTLPPHWYLVHVRTPEWAAAGGTFVGTPAFGVGHNGVAAWGITVGMVDNTDLFLEEVGPDGASVREGDRFVPCDVRDEAIHVKGGPDVVERVLDTPRGPLVGPALGGGEAAMSMRATWLDPRPVQGLLQVHRARTFQEFRNVLEEWPLVSLHMVYADASGTIGSQLIGEAPKRRKGWGTLPLPGWELDAGWEEERVPFEEMPYTSDPPDGFVATANNQPSPDGQGPFLGVDWIDGYRAARIFESLRARQDWDIESAMALQMDQESLPWREIRDYVLSTSTENDAASHALALLRGWDGVVSADSPAAAVFEFTLDELARRIAKARAPRSYPWVLGKGFTQLVPYTFFVARRVGHLVRLVRDQPEGWFAQGWAGVIEESLVSAVKRLREEHGEDDRRWAWGRVRTLTLRHPVGEKKLLGRVFNLGPFPWGGDFNTVAQAATDLADPAANTLAVPSLRMVVEVGNWEESRFSLPGGQSGNPLSPHYDDLLPLWKRGGGVPIAWSPGEVEQATRATLRLVPEDRAVLQTA